MDRVRRRLSFENVLVTAVAFLVLCGSAAYAATHLPKGSVGKRQLKANAVTTAKIKKNAVTAPKIKKGAVTGAKVKDASLEGTDLNIASIPFGRVIHVARGSAVAAGSGLEFAPIPLSEPTFTQAAGEVDTVMGSVDVNFPAGCAAPRRASIFVNLDKPGPLESEEFAAFGQFESKDAGGGTVPINLSQFGSSDVQTAAPSSHTLSAGGVANCAGVATGVTISNLQVEVIGVN